MSLCDTCRDPGACCRRMSFFSAQNGKMVEKTFWDLDHVLETLRQNDLPMVPLSTEIHLTLAGNDFISCLFTCGKLTSRGRCSIYETRPQMCRDFKPGSGPPCVEFTTRT